MLVLLFCCFTLIRGNISSPVRYSYLSILFDDNADIFSASLLIWYCSFSFLSLSWIVMIILYIFSKRFFLKREELFDARVVSISKKRIWFYSSVFIKIHKVLKVSVWWMIKRILLKFSFVWNLYNKILCWIYANIFWNNETRLRDKNKINISFSSSNK